MIYILLHNIKNTLKGMRKITKYYRRVNMDYIFYRRLNCTPKNQLLPILTLLLPSEECAPPL